MLFVNNLADLLEDIERYKQQFPGSYTPYSEIRKTLARLLADRPVVRISHIGSTAVRGIWAKNIVDVMIEIHESGDMTIMR